jgi:TolB-like protein
MKKILSLLILLIFIGCNSDPLPTTNVSSFSFINGVVMEKFGENIIIEIKKEFIFNGNDFESRIGNKIINNSLFITGLSTFIGDNKAKVIDIRGRQVTFKIDKSILKKDDKVKIYVPKKRIAIVDFENISKSGGNIAKPVQENITTKFVQSGQYIVVERSKIKAILKEQQLKEINDDSAGDIGKLVSADLVLTGTFAKKGTNWIVNLRMIDVSTGVIRSAINEKVSGGEFRSSVAKENTNLYIGFDDGKFPDGWAKGLKRKKTKTKIDIDNTTGANGTKSSLKIDFKFKNERSILAFINTKQRDSSRYTGIEFYVKSSSDLMGRVSIHDKNYKDTHVNRFIASYSSGKNWKKVQIPFSNFTLAMGYGRKYPGGDGVFDLDMINSVAIVARGLDNDKKPNTIWIDEVKFY